MLGYGLEQQMSQRLIMTPQLRQSIAILQMTALELAHFAEQQTIENPMLEMDQGPTAEHDEAGDGGAESRRVGERFDIDWQAYFADRSDLGGPFAFDAYDDERQGVEGLARTQDAQYDDLILQLSVLITGTEQMRVARYIISSLDEDGYLRCDVEEAALDLGVSEATFLSVLSVVQSLDPPGIAARDLKECLRLQIGRLDLPPGTKRLCLRIIDDHLTELADRSIDPLARALGLPAADVREASQIIRSLSPRPAFGLSMRGPEPYIIPDLEFRRIDDTCVVIMNDQACPRLTINSYYRQLLGSNEADREAQAFLRERLASALWLVKSIEQRRNTIYRVACYIARHQERFFFEGPLSLRPMTLKDVADEIGVHESTVSRATAMKYALTPWGIYELRFFFQSGVGTVDGDTASAEAVKTIIRDVIAGEDPRKPLSDQAIADLVRQKGILISRRTIAKYRESLRIPSSPERRQAVAR